MLTVIETKEKGSLRTIADRRHSHRHILHGGELLAINPRILGPVRDISMHGMSFEYSGEDLPNIPLMEIGIFAGESKTIITGIQSRTVRDHISDNCSSFIPVIRKIRAVEFIDLSRQQQRQLQQVISLLDFATP